jgi:spore coat polysaccharide biosynthesis protein SpsF
MKEKLNIGIIIQARTGSTRLPNKMILPFYNNKNILEIVIETIKKAMPNQVPIILATTVKESDDCITGIGEKENIFVYRGDEENVLKRFISAAQYYKLDGIIRICADNPCLSGKYLYTLYCTALHDLDDNDYISFSKNDGTPIIKTHYGFWSEYVKTMTLLRISQLSDEALYIEHVTSYIYTHQSDFKLKLIRIPVEYEDKTIRTTVDTIEDFRNIAEMYNMIIKNKMDIEPFMILEFLNRHPVFLDKMNRQIMANQK